MAILINNELINEPIAEGFNNYFSSIAEKLQQNSSFSNNDFSKYLKEPLSHNFIFKSVDVVEIISIIDSP